MRSRRSSVALCGLLLATLALPRGAAAAADATAAGRYIVSFADAADVDAIVTGMGRKLGLAKPAHLYRHAFRGFAGTLTHGQLKALRSDPQVAAIQADERIELSAQVQPTGVRRIGTDRSPQADLDLVDERIDVDVAIVDTGIDPAHPDLNVAGGVNCTTSDSGAWRDAHGHGTHVAGTVGAIDNGIGVVGVAPGARLWSVRVLNAEGWGYLSWYACGLDWITARRDPADASRPLVEVANMSLYKSGRDDGDCGLTNGDIVHRAICRSVTAGITYVVAAGNASTNAAYGIPAAYDEVITVSALADTDGRRGGLGGPACYSWGTYDVDDTFADFSNHGSDVDLIAPGKCIYSTMPGNRYGLSSGTSMATPAVAGAAALYKATHPDASWREVKAALVAAGTLDWRVSSDRDAVHERLLDVSSFGAGPDFSLFTSTPSATVSDAGGRATYVVRLVRKDGFAGPVELAATGLPAGASASFSSPSPGTLWGIASTLTVSVPAGLTPGRYTIGVTGHALDRTRSLSLGLVVDGTPPVVTAPGARFVTGTSTGKIDVPVRLSWSASDAQGVAGSQVQQRLGTASWADVLSTTGSVTTAARWLSPGRLYTFRVRAVDRGGLWSDWATGAPISSWVRQQHSGAVTYSGTWRSLESSAAFGGSFRYTGMAGARVRHSFTGRQIAWVSSVGPKLGRAAVYIDGALVSTVDLYSATTRMRRIVFTRSWATTGIHTIEVRVLGTSGRPRVDIDAFVMAN
jgi:subtilisin